MAVPVSDGKYRIDEEVEVTQPHSMLWQFAHVVEYAGGDEWLVRMDDSGARCKVKSMHIRKQQNLSRIMAAQQLLQAFSDRSKVPFEAPSWFFCAYSFSMQAYDVPHEIGLTVFNNSVNTPITLTKLVALYFSPQLA